MLSLLIYIIFFSCWTNIHCTKWLIDNPGFYDEDMWISGYLPCPHEKVVFPKTYDAILPLPQKVAVNGFVLPRDGAILFSQDSVIDFEGTGVDEPECEGDNGNSYVKPAKTLKWFDPHSWRTTENLEQSLVLPDMQRIPCNNESVIIQRKGSLAIDLENVAYMRMGELSLAGSLISKDYLKYLITTDIGQILFKNSVGVTVEYYRNDICGCHKDFSQFIEAICHNVVETCERPHCLHPITPYQNCCPMCGSVMQFDVRNCDESNLHNLNQAVSAEIVEQGLKAELDYHINYVNSPQFNYSQILQVIVADRNGYSEKSADFMARFMASKKFGKLFDSTEVKAIEWSGRPYNPNITFGSIFLIILCIVFVSIVALIIFAHYAPDNPYLRRIPHWIHDPRRWRALLLRSPFHFARFDNIVAGGPRGSDVQERIIMGYNAQSDQVRERAFDNPMFGENVEVRSSSDTEKTVSKEAKLKTKLRTPTSDEHKLENVTLVDDMEGDEEQEMTEINLDSSAEEHSDTERETKE